MYKIIKYAYNLFIRSGCLHKPLQWRQIIGVYRCLTFVVITITETVARGRKIIQTIKRLNSIMNTWHHSSMKVIIGQHDFFFPRF